MVLPTLPVVSMTVLIEPLERFQKDHFAVELNGITTGYKL